MKRSAVPPRGFPPAEYETRLDRAQRLLFEQDISALLLTTEPEVRYFSGFLTQFWQSPTRPWFVIVPQRGKPIAVIPEIGAASMAATWIDDVYTWPAPFPEDDGRSLLLSILRQVAGRSGRVGLLMGAETHLRMPLGDFLQIREALLGDGCSVVDATPIVRELRLVKSAAEIEKIAHICGLVSAGFSALPDWATPGEIEREIFSKFKIALLRRGADDVPYLVGGAGPGGYGDIISPPSDRGIQVGDVLMLDTGSVFDGYYCDFDRNYAFGTPSERVCRAHDLLYQATETGFKASRPGVTAADVFHAMRRELDQWDSSSNRTGRLGHGLGMQLTEWPSLMPTDETILRPGMVLTLEPGLEIGAGKMMVHEEDIVIRESGAELLTKRAPRELPIIQ